HPYRRRVPPKGGRHAQEHRHTRGAVVCARHRGFRVLRVGSVGAGPGVPMRQKQHPGCSGWVEPGDEVPERERVALGRDMGPRLYNQRVRPPAEQAVEPLGHLLVRLRARNARTERYLGLQVLERGRALELMRRRRGGLMAAGGEAKAHHPDQWEASRHGPDYNPARGRLRLGPRPPGGHLSRVRLLSRYILRQLIAPFCFSLGALTSLMLLNQIARRFGSLVGKGLSWGVIAE